MTWALWLRSLFLSQSILTLKLFVSYLWANRDFLPKHSTGWNEASRNRVRIFNRIECMGFESWADCWETTLTCISSTLQPSLSLCPATCSLLWLVPFPSEDQSCIFTSRTNVPGGWLLSGAAVIMIDILVALVINGQKTECELRFFSGINTRSIHIFSFYYDITNDRILYAIGKVKKSKRERRRFDICEICHINVAVPRAG